MTALGIIAIYIFPSVVVSSIVTFTARKIIFPEKLGMDDTLLLTAIFALIAVGVFMYLFPLNCRGERKDGK